MKPKIRPKSLESQCDDLWYEIIKKRAGYRSELSGVAGKQIGGRTILNAHHIMGKPNIRLLYELDNGICLAHGEHQFGVHHAGRAEEYRTKIIKHIGLTRWNKLLMLRRGYSKVSLKLIKIYLEQVLGELK